MEYTFIINLFGDINIDNIFINIVKLGKNGLSPYLEQIFFFEMKRVKRRITCGMFVILTLWMDEYLAFFANTHVHIYKVCPNIRRITLIT